MPVPLTAYAKAVKGFIASAVVCTYSVEIDAMKVLCPLWQEYVTDAAYDAAELQKFHAGEPYAWPYTPDDMADDCVALRFQHRPARPTWRTTPRRT